MARATRVYFFTRDTHYRSKPISFARGTERIILADGFPLPQGTQLHLPTGRVVPGEFWVQVGEEKGIDVRIALDMIRLTYRNEFDVGIIFSQDQDLSEAVSEVKAIAQDQRRFVELYCAFPYSDQTANAKAIRGTDAIEIDRAVYDTCLDPNKYHHP
jgi:hypothetical protein